MLLALSLDAVCNFPMRPAASCFATAVFVMAMAASTVAWGDIHRYEMEEPLLQIYPSSIKLTNQQRHAVLFSLARDLKVRGGQALAEFVRIALEEMAALYEAEARRSAAGAEGKFIGNRWTETTMAHAHDLYRAADGIGQHSLLDIDIDDSGEMLLLIDGRPFLLTSPVLDQPLLLDDRIIRRVCQEIACDLDLTAVEQGATRRSIVIDADWVITEGKPPEYVTTTGLRFVFHDLQRRSAKQIASLKVIKELELLAGALREAVHKGVSIDQDLLSIKSLYGSYDYRVQLNGFGDTLYIKLPELHHVPDWSTQLWPWLVARMADRPVEHQLPGDTMLSYALGP